MNKYVLGFMFQQANPSEIWAVLLQLKSHPEWQKDKLNGIGGQVGEGEEPVEAMVRECKQETDLDTTVPDWNLFAVLDKQEQWEVHCYRMFVKPEHKFSITHAKNMEGEMPRAVTANSVFFLHNAIPDLKWLIPLALDRTPKGVVWVQLLD